MALFINFFSIFLKLLRNMKLRMSFCCHSISNLLKILYLKNSFRNEKHEYKECDNEFIFQLKDVQYVKQLFLFIKSKLKKI